MKFLLMLIGSLPLLLWGCQSLDNEKNVKIGVIMPRTGEFKNYGTKIIQGMEYFLQQYNAQHKIKLKLLVEDNQSTQDGTVKAFRRLVGNYNVPIVIGAYSSTNTAVLKPFARRAKVPVITPTATNDIVTENNPYMFRTCFTDSYQGLALGNFVKRRLNIKRVGILMNIDENGEYSKGLARSFAAAYKAAGGIVVSEVGYSRQSADFYPLVKQLLDAKVEAIFAPTYLEEATKIIKAARKCGFTGKIFGGDGWDEAALLKSSERFVHHCFFSTMFSTMYNFPTVKTFVNGYERHNHGQVPGLCAAQGYDTIAIVAGLIVNGEINEPAKRLGQVRKFPGVTGYITIKPDGNANKTIFVEQVNKLMNGSFVLELISIVQPSTKK